MASTTTAPASAPTPAPTTTSTTTPAPAPVTAPVQPFHTASLYVGDIHPEVTEALLFEIFNAVGPVASIRVCRDAVTRRSLGYAYVNFHNVADAERALDTMNYTSIKGVPCRIMWSQRDPTLRKSGVGNIFVKNLSTDVDNKALYDTFSLFGNILSCKVVNDYTGNSKGYGYVHYETQEAAEEAIEKINGMLIAGQEVYVGQFQKRQERGDEVVFTNCYVKNIPSHWTEDMLRKEFQPFGTITSCVIMKGQNETAAESSTESTSKCSFGFVNYEDPDAAAAAVEALNGHVFKSEDEQVEIEMYVGKAQKKSERERELRAKFDALKTERINKYQGVNLYVKNIDDTMTDDELREAFAVHGSITSARIMRDPASGASRGFGFVCYATPEESTKAVSEMNGKILSGGKPVYVALAQRKEVRRAQLEAQHAQRQSSMMNMNLHPSLRAGPMGQPPMYGTAPMFYAAQPNQPRNPQQPGGPAPVPFMYPQHMQHPAMMQQMNPQYRQGQPPRGGMPTMGGYAGQPGQGVRPPFQNQGPNAPQMYMNPNQNQNNRRGPNNTNSNNRRGPRNQGQQQQRQGQQYAANTNSNAAQNQFKYTANARNQPGMSASGPSDALAMNNAAQVPTTGPNQPLTPAALANASPELQKNMIGERLYPMIHLEQPELAGKITGMLLEMDNGELLHLLESPEALTSKIQEAIQVLEEHAEPTTAETATE